MSIIPSQCVTIDDPLNPHNNVSKSSFKFYEIKVSISNYVLLDGL
jgi:hypothetical protein